MNVIRTEQMYINSNDTLSNLCHISKNLWNEALYPCRQAYFHNKYNLNEPKINIPNYSILAGTLKTSDNYKRLNAQTSQQILKVLTCSWTSYWNSIKEYNKNPNKFLGKPKMPDYKDKDGEHILIFTNQQCFIKNKKLRFPPSIKIKPIETRLSDSTDLREVRIVPKGSNYVCEIVYAALDEEGIINKRWYSKKINNNRIIGIDVGTRNIVAIANNIGLSPIVIKGGVLKSINQYYNKKLAELQTTYNKQSFKNGKVGEAMLRLISKRNRKIKDQMHKISHFIVDYCLKHNIGTVVIGHNEGWKQEVEMGKKNNQNFVMIPFNKLIEQIQYKVESKGIMLIIQEESHTSKCSFLDNETINHHEFYVGARFKRGLFRSAKGTIINADVQGGLNIIKKAIPKAFKGIEDVVLHPIRIELSGNTGSNY